jgi:hypothetical protein
MVMNVFLFFILLASSPSRQTTGAPGPPDVIEVTPCDLLKQPLTFANRHVRVRATIETGPEFVVIRCVGNADVQGCIWLDQPTDDDTLRYARGWSSQQFVDSVRSGALEGEGPQATWQIPALLVASRAQFNLGKLAQARALITGRFDYYGDGVLVKSRNHRYSWQAGFGHLNACPSRLVLEAVDRLGNSP